MKTCPDCGSPVYNLGCTWCNEALYIEEQNHFDRMAEWERQAEQKQLPAPQREDKPNA